MVFALPTLGNPTRRLAPLAVVLSGALLFVAGFLRMSQPTSPELSVTAAPAASGRLRLVVSRVRSETSHANEKQPSEDSGATSPLGVAGARVRVFHALPDARYALVAEGRTDAQGQLSLEHLPMGYAWLLVDAPGLERWSRGLVVEARAPEPVEVELRQAQPLRVEVRDGPELLLPGATVIVRGSDGLPFGGVTGEQGRVNFDQVPVGPLQVEVFARGFEPARREGVQRELQVELRPLGGLDVHVLDPQGDPAGRAEVLLVGSSLWPARRLQADEDGVARMTNLPAGVYDLRARRAMFVSPIVSGVRLERGQRRRLDLRLLPGRQVQVIVRAARSEPPQPIAGARVVLAEYGLSAFPLQGVSNAAGQVRLGPIPEGPAFVSVRAPDYIGRHAVAVPRQSTEPVVVELWRGARLRGRVTDPSGRPVDGARIEVVGVDLDGQPIAESPLMAVYRDAHFDSAMRPLPWISSGELGVTVGPVPYVNAVLDSVSRAPPNASFADLPDVYTPWVTDYDGAFRAEPIPPGRARVIVRHPSFLEGTSPLMQLSPGGDDFVEVVLDEGHRLLGRVMDERGFPVPRARISVTGTTTPYERSLTVGDDGTFRLESVPREIDVALARPEEPTRFVHRKTVELSSEAAREVEFVLPARRAPMAMTVTDAAGRAVDLAQVSVLSVDPLIPVRVTRFTDAAGRVEVPDVRGVAARVTVQAPSYVGYARQFDSLPEHLDVNLAQGVLVRGTVTAVRGHQVVAGARVTLQTEDGNRDATLTSGLGEYEFRNVPSGGVGVTVVHDDFARVRRRVQIEDPGHVGRAFELAPIDLPDATTLRGIVVEGGTERPVAGAWIGLDELGQVTLMRNAGEEGAVSDLEGRFVLRGLAPGVHEVFALSRAHGRGSVKVRVEAERKPNEIRIALMPDDVDRGDARAAAIAVALDEPPRDGSRLVIRAVAPHSEAERAGLRAGDMLLHIDGATPRSRAEAWRRLSGRLGSDVVVGVRRGGQRLDFRVRRESVP